jgi:DUF4097 and DUF4098 domain-containing protein YvlB
MRGKTIWIIVLSLALLVICGLMVLVGLIFIRQVGLPHLGLSGIQAGVQNTSMFSDESKTITVSTPASLIIENPFGNVNLNGTEGDEIQITMHRTAWGIDQEAAQKRLQELKVDITQEGDTVRIKVLPPEGRTDNMNIMSSVDFNIQVPLDTAVNATVMNGELELTRLQADAVLSSDFGQVRVTDLQQGKLSAASKNGPIIASQILSGDNPIDLSSDFGDVTLNNANGSTVSASSNNGPITLENVKSTGAVTLSSDFGSVSFNEGQAGSLKAVSKNGEISMNVVKINGLLTVQSDFGSITLKHTDADSYDLQNKNGGISVDGASGSMQAGSDFGEINILNGENCDLNITTKNGGISYQGSLGKGPHTLTSDFGNVTLRIPADTPLTVDLKTEFGQITNDFEITTKGTVEDKHLTGKINGGGASLNVQVNNGEINLQTLNQKEQ